MTEQIHFLNSEREHAVSAWRDLQQTKLYDVLAALPLVSWYGASALRLVPSLVERVEQADLRSIDSVFAISVLAQTSAIALILLAIIFLLIRRPARSKAKGLLPRFAAFGGTYLGVAVVWLPVQPAGFALTLASLVMMLGGVSFAIYALAHLGRSFSLMAEARRLVTDGPYASIRHPLYLAEAISMVGLMLRYLSPLAVTIVALQLSFQFMRMKNEEAVLAGLFPEYEAYKARTARLVPGLY
jgi:protein-S-isoprenylcysteine O-methyltransferase Ste14